MFTTSYFASNVTRMLDRADAALVPLEFAHPCLKLRPGEWCTTARSVGVL
ncbi:MAG: hypothetical protein JWR32_2688 [Mycobacterium sp.]|jgi:hypothetical protein|nr:hypothetical protein [Mycobacterium sp.]